MQRSLYLLLIAVLALGAVRASGPEAGGDTVNVIVSADHTPTPVTDSIASATVITAAQLRTQGAVTVADALRLVPGASIAENGQMGSLASPSIRGVMAYQVLVLVDGRRVSSPAFSNTDLAKLPLADVSRIEVIRGPVSALYGSDAFGGVINIITRKPFAHGGEVHVSLGANDRATRELSLHGAGRRTSWRFTGSTPTFGGDRPNSDFDATSLSGSLGITGLRGGWDATVTLEAYHDSLGLPGDVVNPTPNDHQWWRRQTMDLALSRARTADRADVRLYRVKQELHNVAFGMWAADSTFTGTTDALEATYAITRGRHQAVAGLEVRREDYENIESSGTQTNDLQNTGAFLQDRWSVNPRTDVVAGLRVDDHSEAGTRTTPRLGVVHAVRADTRVRASYAEGFRAPNFNESFGSSFANPNPALKPETSRQLEVGTTLSRGRSDLDLAVFRSRVHDQITYVMGAWPAKGDYKNTKRVRQQGAELSLGHRFADVRVAAAYSFLEAKDLDTDARVKRVPRHKVGVTVSGTVAKTVDTALTARWMDGWVDTDPQTWGNTHLPGRLVMDLSLQHTALRGATRLSPYLIVRNLTDVQYDTIAGYPAEGRGIEGGVRTSW